MRRKDGTGYMKSKRRGGRISLIHTRSSDGNAIFPATVRVPYGDFSIFISIDSPSEKTPFLVNPVSLSTIQVTENSRKALAVVLSEIGSTLASSLPDAGK